MGQLGARAAGAARWRRLALPLLAMLGLSMALLASSPTRAQETPEGTPAAEGTPTNTVVRAQVDPAVVQPIDAGEEFEVQVLVENVGHLGFFDFAIQYDPKRVEPVEAGAQPAQETPAPEPGGSGGVQIKGSAGEFLQDSGRGESVLCNGPFFREGGENGSSRLAYVTCVSTHPPVCLGGPAGPSGSGVLGRVTFRSKGGGETTLRLVDPTHLGLDDISPCDPEIARAVEIQHRREDVTVELVGGGGLPWAIIVPIVVVVIVVVAGGGGGYWYLRYGRRSAGPAV